MMAECNCTANNPGLGVSIPQCGVLTNKVASLNMVDGMMTTVSSSFVTIFLLNSSRITFPFFIWYSSGLVLMKPHLSNLLLLSPNVRSLIESLFLSVVASMYKFSTNLRHNLTFSSLPLFFGVLSSMTLGCCGWHPIHWSCSKNTNCVWHAVGMKPL